MSFIGAVFVGFLIMGAGLGAVAYLIYRQKLRKAKAIERGLKMVPVLIHLPPQSQDTQGGSRDVKEVMREKTAQAEVLYNLLAGTTVSGFKSAFYGQRHVALELIAADGIVHFYAAVPVALVSTVEKAIQTAYPGARLEMVEDHNIFNQEGRLAATLGGEMVLRTDSAYPIATYAKLDRDPMEALLTSISALEKLDGVAFQLMIRPATPNWIAKSLKLVDMKRRGRHGNGLSPADVMQGMVKSPEQRRDENRARLGSQSELTNLQQSEIESIEEKTKHPGFEVLIRVIVSTGSVQRSQQLLRDIATTFALYDSPGLNGFTFLPAVDVQGLVTAFIFRFFPPELKGNVLNSVELATLFHLPDAQFVPSSSVERQKSKQIDGPVRLPSVGLLFGYNEFRGVRKEIRLSEEDRRRHSYILGQTGTGKSTMLENLAVQDMLAGNGFAFIDPHGDSAEKLLALVPKNRAEDIIYFNPGDTEFPLGLNLFEFTDPAQKDFLVQETINMLYKLYDPGHTGIIGPRYEHWYRNAALTLMSDPNGATFIEIPKVFTDTDYLKQKFKYLKDPTVIDFWTKEMGQTSDYHKSEMLGWFVSKFGAFQNNEMMRNIIGQTKSSFNLRDIMDNKKILIVNLSKGRVGELNSQLLGMMFVIKFQAAAMSRANVTEDQRPDFALYVDEFQNFSTDSFASILSEARKYRLNLIVANQFIGQLKPEIRDAVFGNIGTIVAHRMGPEDAEFMVKQFAPVFDASDLMNIPNYNAAMRLMIGGLPSQPFTIVDSPPLGKPNLALGLAVKQLSAAKYGHERAVVEAEIMSRLSGQPIMPAPAPQPAPIPASVPTASPMPAASVVPQVQPEPVPMQPSPLSPMPSAAMPPQSVPTGMPAPAMAGQQNTMSDPLSTVPDLPVGTAGSTVTPSHSAPMGGMAAGAGAAPSAAPQSYEEQIGQRPLTALEMAQARVSSGGMAPAPEPMSAAPGTVVAPTLPAYQAESQLLPGEAVVPPPIGAPPVDITAVRPMAQPQPSMQPVPMPPAPMPVAPAMAMPVAQSMPMEPPAQPAALDASATVPASGTVPPPIGAPPVDVIPGASAADIMGDGGIPLMEEPAPQPMASVAMAPVAPVAAPMPSDHGTLSVMDITGGRPLPATPAQQYAGSQAISQPAEPMLPQAAAAAAPVDEIPLMEAPAPLAEPLPAEPLAQAAGLPTQMSEQPVAYEPQMIEVGGDPLPGDPYAGIDVLADYTPPVMDATALAPQDANYVQDAPDIAPVEAPVVPMEPSGMPPLLETEQPQAMIRPRSTQLSAPRQPLATQANAALAEPLAEPVPAALDEYPDVVPAEPEPLVQSEAPMDRPVAAPMLQEQPSLTEQPQLMAEEPEPLQQSVIAEPQTAVTEPVASEVAGEPEPPVSAVAPTPNEPAAPESFIHFVDPKAAEVLARPDIPQRVMAETSAASADSTEPVGSVQSSESSPAEQLKLRSAAMAPLPADFFTPAKKSDKPEAGKSNAEPEPAVVAEISTVPTRPGALSEGISTKPTPQPVSTEASDAKPAEALGSAVPAEVPVAAPMSEPAPVVVPSVPAPVSAPVATPTPVAAVLPAPAINPAATPAIPEPVSSVPTPSAAATTPALPTPVAAPVSAPAMPAPAEQSQATVSAQPEPEKQALAAVPAASVPPVKPAPVTTAAVPEPAASEPAAVAAPEAPAAVAAPEPVAAVPATPAVPVPQTPAPAEPATAPAPAAPVVPAAPAESAAPVVPAAPVAVHLPTPVPTPVTQVASAEPVESVAHMLDAAHMPMPLTKADIKRGAVEAALKDTAQPATDAASKESTEPKAVTAPTVSLSPSTPVPAPQEKPSASTPSSVQSAPATQQAKPATVEAPAATAPVVASSEEETAAAQLQEAQHEIDDLLSDSLIKLDGRKRLPDASPELAETEEGQDLAVEPEKPHVEKVLRPTQKLHLNAPAVIGRGLMDLAAAATSAAPQAAPAPTAASVPAPVPQAAPSATVAPAAQSAPTTPPVRIQPATAPKPAPAAPQPVAAQPSVRPTVIQPQVRSAVPAAQSPARYTASTPSIMKHGGNLLPEVPAPEQAAVQEEESLIPQAESLAADDVARARAEREAQNKLRAAAASQASHPAPTAAQSGRISRHRQRRRDQEKKLPERVESAAEAEHNRPTEAEAQVAPMTGKLIMPSAQKPHLKLEPTHPIRPKKLAPGEVYVDEHGNVIVGE